MIKTCVKLNVGNIGEQGKNRAMKDKKTNENHNNDNKNGHMTTNKTFAVYVPCAMRCCGKQLMLKDIWGKENAVAISTAAPTVIHQWPEEESSE